MSNYISDYHDNFNNFGKTTPIRFYLWIEALRMARLKLNSKTNKTVEIKMKFKYMINTNDKTRLFRDIIFAKDREKVNEHILSDHADLFPNGNLYQKRKNDQFDYVYIFELLNKNKDKSHENKIM